MTYLTYEEYKGLGGNAVDETAFNRNIDRACGIIDNAIHHRLDNAKEISRKVKACTRDLIEYLAKNEEIGIVASRSQSAGGVSESESYATKTADDVYGDIQNILYDYLASEKDEKGTPLLYRGCKV